jgi:PAS domain-containing protein
MPPLLNARVPAQYTVLVNNRREYVEVSPSFCNLLGYAKEQLLGKKFDFVTAPGTNSVPIVFELFERLGYMHGVWVFINRTNVRIIVRYEAWLRADGLIECNMELLGAGA